MGLSRDFMGKGWGTSTMEVSMEKIN